MRAITSLLSLFGFAMKIDEVSLHKPPSAAKALWVSAWLRMAASAGATCVWLLLALVAAARGDWLIMGVDMLGVLTGVAALCWAAHLLLQLADTDALARFAYHLAAERLDVLLEQYASIERPEEQWLN
ncbi:hypothetical protein [Candidatus Viadribacter manganicus]|uniref:Uncharacterized protein n=1 Tax=Candidatus Viadribacter manganicus TaxID=1759059 RepID=A0A1B1AHQ5_9PROT|nr:hypothetical protein [Candidatus Viadribacter manganicus]ANP46070.1 hypothetical protein ATE48_09120 [Candidatus Viadribacter manganicus]